MYTILDSFNSEQKMRNGFKELVKFRLISLIDPFAPDPQDCASLRECEKYFMTGGFLELVEICYEAGFRMDVLLDLVNEVLAPEEVKEVKLDNGEE